MDSFTVPSDEIGKRLDTLIARRLDLTRSQAEKLAKTGNVRVNGKPALPGYRVTPGEQIEVNYSPTLQATPAPEPIPLDILFEDDHIIVANKAQGMVTHPTPGHATGTLVNALLAHTSALAREPGPMRPGIVHRLDRDTSGLLVVAKDDDCYRELSRQVRSRELARHYLALVWGNFPQDQMRIAVPIGRHHTDRTRMAAVLEPRPVRRVRPAITDVRVVERLETFTLVEAKLPTGRTHQIRVHLSQQGYPVVGDRVYGLRRAKKGETALDAETLERVRALPGQALHAYYMRFQHPATGQEVDYSSPPPEVMARLLAYLRSRMRKYTG